MSLDHDTGVFNVEGSLAAWMNAALLARKPASAPTATVNLNYPEQPLTPPQWSISFLGINPDALPFQGGHVGGGQVGGVRFGIMEVSCWGSRKAVAWRKQIAQLADAVTQAVTDLLHTGGSIPIHDFYADEQVPVELAYRIVISRVEERETAPDPNPDIERRRLLVYYKWTERS